MNDKIDSNESDLSFWWSLLWSLSLTVLLYYINFEVVENALWCTRHHSLSFYFVFAGVFWGFTFFPWSIICYYRLCFLKRWEPSRVRRWILAPPVGLLLLVIICGLIVTPPSSSSRLKYIQKKVLPQNAMNFHSELQDCGILSEKDLYYFEAPSAKIEDLINSLSFKEGSRDYTPWLDFKTCPNPLINAKFFSEGKFRRLFYKWNHVYTYDLMTNASRTQAYLTVTWDNRYLWTIRSLYIICTLGVLSYFFVKNSSN